MHLHLKRGHRDQVYGETIGQQSVASATGHHPAPLNNAKYKNGHAQRQVDFRQHDGLLPYALAHAIHPDHSFLASAVRFLAEFAFSPEGNSDNEDCFVHLDVGVGLSLERVYLGNQSTEVFGSAVYV